MVSPPLNPYAPPQSADASQPALVYGDFDLGRTVTDAWEACKKHFPLWFLVGFVGMLLVVVSMITIIGYFVVVPVFFFGGIKFLLNMVDGQPSFDDLFAGFKNYLTALGRMLLLTVIFVTMALLAESLVFVGQYLDSVALVAIGGVIYLAFAFGVLVRFYFAVFLVVDRDMGAIDSLATSWRMTQGKTLKLVGLAILSSFIAVAGMLACGIGMFLTVTMAYVMYASAYRQIIGPPPRPAPIPAW